MMTCRLSSICALPMSAWREREGGKRDSKRETERERGGEGGGEGGEREEERESRGGIQ